MIVRTMVVACALAALAGSAPAQCPSSCAAGEKATSKEHVNEAVVDIVDTAIAGNFKTLVAALKAADLVEALRAKGPFTVFAPTDEAFAKLPKGTLETLLKPENKGKLQAILKYHVLAASVPSKEVKTGAAVTLNGQRVDLTAKDKTVTVDKAKVVSADVECTNGVIHAIDTVLIPSDKTIVETAAAHSSFKTLATLLEKADLTGALSGEGPFTVFAPTDEAFAKLPKETVDNLLKPENKAQLQAILKYHVVQGRVFSDAALKAGHAKTLQGGEIRIKTEGKAAKVNDATLTTTDLDASNGVIHVVDTVLLPK